MTTDSILTRIQSISVVLKSIPAGMLTFVTEHLVKISSHTFGWISLIMLHFASLPSLWAVLQGNSDKLPDISIMVFIWSALTTLFVKAVLDKDNLYVTTIALGFVCQTVVSGLILFK